MPPHLLAHHLYINRRTSSWYGNIEWGAQRKIINSENKNKKIYNYGKDVSKKEILKYADEKFGKDAGIIQQHLFYNIRENLI